MKVFWFVRAEQGHKSAGDTQFIQLLRCLFVQVYRAKKKPGQGYHPHQRQQRSLVSRRH